MLALGAALLGAASALSIRAASAQVPPAASEDAVAGGEGSWKKPRRERIDDLFWVDAESGVAHVGLDTLSTGDVLHTEVLESSDSAFVWGVGAGLRSRIVTLGARFRHGDFAYWNFWTLNAEAALRIPIAFIEPSLSFGAGYAAVGSFEFTEARELERAGVDIAGVDLRYGLGLDVYLPGAFSVGVRSTGELLLLARPAVNPRRFSNVLTAVEQELYAEDGASVGTAHTTTAVLGAHF